MRTQTPLAPGQPDVTVHFVLFGGLGRAYVETDEAEADQATIVDNILSGQYSSPLRVIAVNTTARCDRGHCACRARPRAQRPPPNR